MKFSHVLLAIGMFGLGAGFEAFLERPQEIINHPSGQAVYIRNQACVVNDIKDRELYGALVTWCASFK